MNLKELLSNLPNAIENQAKNYYENGKEANKKVKVLCELHQYNFRIHLEGILSQTSVDVIDIYLPDVKKGLTFIEYKNQLFDNLDVYDYEGFGIRYHNMKPYDYKTYLYEFVKVHFELEYRNEKLQELKI